MWTEEDEKLWPIAKFQKKDPREFYGAVAPEISHYCKNNPDTFMVETWGSFHGFQIKTRQRPMTEAEIILCKLDGHSREAVIRAFGIQECYCESPRERKTTWIERIKLFCTHPYEGVWEF